MKVLELKGYKSLRAFNAYHTLLLGMKMLPIHIAESYEEFYGRVEEMTETEQEKLLKEAALFVKLDKEELEALICFCTDKNGVPYEPANLSNLKPDEIVEVIVAVCKEMLKIKVDLVSDSEKKNLTTTASISASTSLSTPH